MTSKLWRPAGIALAILATAAGVAYATRGGAPTAPPPVHLLSSTAHHRPPGPAGDHGASRAAWSARPGRCTRRHRSNGADRSAGPARRAPQARLGRPARRRARPDRPARKALSGATAPPGRRDPPDRAARDGSPARAGRAGGREGRRGRQRSGRPGGTPAQQARPARRGATGAAPAPTATRAEAGTGPNRRHRVPKGEHRPKGRYRSQGRAGPRAHVARAAFRRSPAREPERTRLDYDASGKAALTCVSGSAGGSGDGGGGTPLVRINEIQTGTSSSGSDEFVELVNAGTASADIGGWKVVYRSAAGTSDTSLGTIPPARRSRPGGFYLLGGSVLRRRDRRGPVVLGRPRSDRRRGRAARRFRSAGRRRGLGYRNERARRGLPRPGSTGDRGTRFEPRTAARRPRHRTRTLPTSRSPPPRRRAPRTDDLLVIGCGARVLHRRPSRDHPWEERPAFGSDEPRFTSDITTTAGLSESRARIWRLPGPLARTAAQRADPGGGLRRARRHAHDPARRSARSIRPRAAQRRGRQAGNRASRCATRRDAEVAIFAYGAPPVAGAADYLDDIEQL